MHYDVITIGSATCDVFLTSSEIKTVGVVGMEHDKAECVPFGGKVEVDDLFFSIGGGAINAATTFTNLQLTVAPIARIGDDIHGKYIINQLEQYGVSTARIVQDKELHTAYSTILMSQEGDRTVLVHRGASQKLTTTNIPIEQLDSSWIYITSLSSEISFLKDIVIRARRKNIKVAINPGKCELEKGLEELKPILKEVDVIMMNSEEAVLVTGDHNQDIKDTIETIANETPGIVVVTDGANGAYVSPAVLDKQAVYFSHAYETEPVNTTGAGDAFGSGFVAGLIHFEGDIKKALQLATLNSGHVIQEMGAQAGLLKGVPGDHVLNEIKISTVD